MEGESPVVPRTSEGLRDARDTSRRRYYSDTLSLAALFLAMRRAALVTVQVLRCSFAQNKTCARIRQRLPWKVLRSRGSVLGLSRGFHHMPPAPPTFASHTNRAQITAGKGRRGAASWQMFGRAQVTDYGTSEPSCVKHGQTSVTRERG
jgi:hypothetical protein